MTQPPAAPPLPPPRRPIAPPRTGKRRGGLFKLLAILAALLVLASWLGQRKPAEPDAPPVAAVTPPRPATSTATVIKPQAGAANATATPKDARFSVSGDGLLLTIEGDVGSRFAHDLKLALDANPSLQRIVITSGGGYAGPGLDAAQLWDDGVDFSVVDAQGRRMTREQVRDFLSAKYGRPGRG